MQYANAGHFPSGILTSPGEASCFLASGNLPLGLRAHASYENHTVNLAEHFMLVMFSDGVFELMAEANLNDLESKLLSITVYGQSDADKIFGDLSVPGSVTSDDVAVFSISR